MIALGPRERVLRYLGAKDLPGLLAILKGHLTNDTYYDNGVNTFLHVLLSYHNSSCANFLHYCTDYSGKLCDQMFSRRYEYSRKAVPLYAAATVTSFAATPVAGAAVSGVATLALGFAESRLKRNVATNHTFEHFYDACIKIVTEMYVEQYRDHMTPEAQEKVNGILGIKDSNKLKAKLSRWASYVSGSALSGVRAGLDWAHKLSNSTNVAFGSVIPFMPVVNTWIAQKSTNWRVNGMIQKAETTEKVLDELFQAENYKDPSSVDFEVMADEFGHKMAKPLHEHKHNCVVESGNKVLSVTNYLGNLVHRGGDKYVKVGSKVGSLLKKIGYDPEVVDLTARPSELIGKSDEDAFCPVVFDQLEEEMDMELPNMVHTSANPTPVEAKILRKPDCGSCAAQVEVEVEAFKNKLRVCVQKEKLETQDLIEQQRDADALKNDLEEFDLLETVTRQDKTIYMG